MPITAQLSKEKRQFVISFYEMKYLLRRVQTCNCSYYIVHDYVLAFCCFRHEDDSYQNFVPFVGVSKN